MAAMEKISFAFKAATTFTLDELCQRAGEPDINHLMQSTLDIYEAYLQAQANNEKFVAIHPQKHDVREIHDIESIGRHRLMGIVHLSGDMERAHTLKRQYGETTTQGLLTKALILRERVVEAQEHGWKVGVWKAAEATINVFPDMIPPEQRHKALHPVLN